MGSVPEPLFTSRAHKRRGNRSNNPGLQPEGSQGLIESVWDFQAPLLKGLCFSLLETHCFDSMSPWLPSYSSPLAHPARALCCSLNVAQGLCTCCAPQITSGLTPSLPSVQHPFSMKPFRTTTHSPPGPFPVSLFCRSPTTSHYIETLQTSLFSMPVGCFSQLKCSSKRAGTSVLFTADSPTLTTLGIQKARTDICQLPRRAY